MRLHCIPDPCEGAYMLGDEGGELCLYVTQMETNVMQSIKLFNEV